MFAQIADGSVSRWGSGTPGAFAGVPARGELRSGYGNSSARKGSASGAASGFLWTLCVFLHFFTHFVNEACLPSTSGPAQCAAPSRGAQSGSTSSTPRLPVRPLGCTGDEPAGGRSQEMDSKSLLPPGVSHPLEASGGPSEVPSTPPVPCPSGHWQPWCPHPCASRSPVQCHPCVKPCTVPSWCHAELTLSPTCSLHSSSHTALGLCHHARCASPARPPRHTPSRQCDTLALQCHLRVTSRPCTHTAEPCAAPPALPPRPGSVTPCQPRSVPPQCATA